MNKTIFNLFAALAFIFAASSLAIHQSASAVGAYRTGGVADVNGFGDDYLHVVAGVAVGADDAATAIQSAQQRCVAAAEIHDANGETGSTNSFAYVAGGRCTETPQEPDTVDSSYDTTDATFRNACIVVVRSNDPLVQTNGTIHRGVGTGSNCQDAMDLAVADCTATPECDANNRIVVRLYNTTDTTGTNTTDTGLPPDTLPLYAIDGNARVCREADEYDFTDDGSGSMDATDGITCSTPNTNGECAVADSNNPVFIGGTCQTCPTGEIANAAAETGCSVPPNPENNADCRTINITLSIYDSSDDSCRNPQSMAECMALNTEFDTGLPILNNNDTADNPTDDFCRSPQTNDECQTHEDLSIYDEGMMMCRTAVGTDCLNATNLRTQTPILQDGDCVAATTAAECKAASALANIAPERQFVATAAEGFAGGCAALSAEICSNTNEDATPTPIWQVNITTNIESCVAATAANHAGCLLIDNETKPIPGDNGECRAAESSAECATYYADSRSIAATTADLAGACVAPTAADCAATNEDATPTPILEGTICTAATNEGCLANVAFAGRKPIAEDGRCVRANTPSDCATAHPDLPLLDLGNLGGCSANTAELCIAANDRRPIPDGGECIAAADDGQCRDNHGPNLPRAEFRNNTTTGRCVSCEAIDVLRPFYNADTDQCELAHDNQDCRTANMDKPIATTDSQGNPAACRAVESINDCDAEYPDYQVINNVRRCEIRTAAYCYAINPELPAVSADGTACVATPTVATASGGNGDGKGAVFAGAVAVGLWLFYNHYTAGAGEGVNWTPSYAYNSDNGNISYAVGSRWNATADNMKFYWQTSHNSGDGRISYGSGISYSDKLFGATMNTASDLDETTMDLNLSAKTGGEQWQLSGGYHFDLQREEKQAKTETENRLNIAANYRINQWQLSATANGNADVNGLSIIAKYELDRWILSATANADNDEAAAKVNYSYRF